MPVLVNDQVVVRKLRNASVNDVPQTNMTPESERLKPEAVQVEFI